METGSGRFCRISATSEIVPAKTGEVSEYGALPDKNVSPEVAQRIAAFVQ